MADAPNLAKLVPGFEFLQSLAQGATSALPGLGQWVAPTLDPKEIDKRIEELRTVQFWLEQNARLLGTTIQALEVQRMTLSTLQTMNVRMDDLRESLTLRPAAAASAAAASPSATEKSAASAAKGDSAGADEQPPPNKGQAGPTPAVDPMQWWGALTQQFTQLASAALRDAAGSKPAAPAPAKAPAAGAASPAAPAKRAARKSAAPRKRAG